MEEIWKDIIGYEGLYGISINGNIYSYYSNKVLKPNKTNTGYSYVCLCKNKTYKKFKIHRLMLSTFIGISNLQINHKNGIRDDNRLENLEYCTQSYNMKHSYNKLGRINPMLGKIGKLCPSSKSVIQYDLNGRFIKIWHSMRDVERELNIDTSSISKCCTGKNKTCKGFIFRYNIINDLANV